MIEDLHLDKKSLLFFTDPAKVGWKDLAKDCVAFANTRGGTLILGIEDADTEPSSGQTISPDLINQVQKNITNLTVSVSVAPEIITHPNGGEFLSVKVHGNRQSLACTTDGKYYYRVGDECKPVMPDELVRLLAEKDMYSWESHCSKRVSRNEVDENKLTSFINAIRTSDRVSDFVREKTLPDLLEYYALADGEFLTNLGILWIGLRKDRAQLRYAPVIQFTKFNEREEKIRKLVWDDHELTPLELIDAVWNDIPEWREFTEFPDGIFRKQIPHYDQIVIRELMANALVHRPYTTAGDLFINLHPEHVEFHNPGRFPLGVTGKNILHKSVRRNDALAKVFYDLKLMEREGSGYDKIYETQLSQAKSPPNPREDEDRICVTVSRTIIKPEILDFLAKAEQEFPLSQRERITLSLIAQHGSLTSLEFSAFLDLQNEDTRIRHWIGSLQDRGIVLSKGRTRATTYSIAPQVLRNLSFSGLTTLKPIAEHRLRELVLSDLTIHGPSSVTGQAIGKIHERIGQEIPRRQLRKTLQDLQEEQLVSKQGERKSTVYFLTESGNQLMTKPSDLY